MRVLHAVSEDPQIIKSQEAKPLLFKECRHLKFEIFRLFFRKRWYIFLWLKRFPADWPAWKGFITKNLSASITLESILFFKKEEIKESPSNKHLACWLSKEQNWLRSLSFLLYEVFPAYSRITRHTFFLPRDAFSNTIEKERTISSCSILFIASPPPWGGDF